MKIFNILLLLSLAFVPGHAFAGEKLTGDEIKSTFEGNTYHWKHAKRSDSGKSYLDANGDRILTKNGKSFSGSWSIKGNQICFQSPKSSVCRDVEKGKEGTYYLVKDGSKRVVYITQIESGKVL